MAAIVKCVLIDFVGFKKLGHLGLQAITPTELLSIGLFERTIETEFCPHYWECFVDGKRTPNPALPETALGRKSRLHPSRLGDLVLNAERNQSFSERRSLLEGG